MEAICRLGTYAPKCKLTLEFSGSREQEFLSQSRLAAVVQAVAVRHPWYDREGVPLKTFVISQIVLHPETHPDYGPETEMVFGHRNLALRHLHLKPYEQWARAFGVDLSKRISEILKPRFGSSGICWEIEISYVIPVRELEAMHQARRDRRTQTWSGISFQ